jgi:hypothetical protein
MGKLLTAFLLSTALALIGTVAQTPCGTARRGIERVALITATDPLACKTMNTRLKQYLRLAEQADSNAVEYEPFKIKDKVSIQVSAITRSVA